MFKNTKHVCVETLLFYELHTGCNSCPNLVLSLSLSHNFTGPDPNKIVERQPGILYAVDCSIISGSCNSLEFHLNDMPLNMQCDGNLRIAYCELEISSLSSAYEGFYNCSYNGLPSTLQECIYVLGEFGC